MNTQELSMVGLPITVFTEFGPCPGQIITGLDGGPCDVVVFGMKTIGKGPGGVEVTKRKAAEVLEAVPYGQTGKDRQSLYPYWDHASR